MIYRIVATVLFFAGLSGLAMADRAQIIKNGVVYDAPAGYEARWVPKDARLNFFVAKQLEVVKTQRVDTVEPVKPPPTVCREDDELVTGPVPPCK